MGPPNARGRAAASGPALQTRPAAKQAEVASTVQPAADSAPPYQPMPALSPEDFALLKADIADHGVMVPVEVDEDGNILDGHNRSRACAELGISPPTVVRAGLTEAQKHEHALRSNLVRRHLTSAQKREVIRAELDRDPDRSDREIARLIGVDHKTVGTVRRGESPREMFTLPRIKHHPAADIWPMMDDDELAWLAESIKQIGLIYPITLDRDGLLLDGKNRLAACQIAEVEPTFTSYDGDDPYGYVNAVNGLVKHYSEIDKAQVVAAALKYGQSELEFPRAWRDAYWAQKAKAKAKAETGGDG